MPPELAAQLGLVRRVVDAFGLAQLEVPGFEADDIIASLAKVATGAGMEVVICSSDKDLMQLCCGEVFVLDTMRNRRFGAGEVREKFGVGPEQVGDVLALMGDSIDNVPGVDGIGPKTAAELINKFGSLDVLLERVSEVKGKRGIAIAEARDAIRVSRELVRLREDVPLPKTLAEMHRSDPDQQRLRGAVPRAGVLAPGRAADHVRSRKCAARRPRVAPPRPRRRPRRRCRCPAPAPLDPAEIILDRAALADLVAAVEAAGAVGLAALWDGVSAVRAELVGLGLALPGGRRAYVPFHHRYLGAPACLPEGALADLAPVLSGPAIARHTHDAKTLEVLLTQRGVALGPVASDSMLAAYLLDAARTHYDLDVVAASEGVARRPRARPGWGRAPRLGLAATSPSTRWARDWRPRPPPRWRWPSGREKAWPRPGSTASIATMELPLARALARIECRGITLDVAKLREIGHEVGAVAGRAGDGDPRAGGGAFNIASNKQLADVLFGKLSLPVIRRTKTGPSTDADTLEELARLHAVPAKIVEFRALSKLRGTYIDALPALVNPATGRLHTSFNQAVAATGRLSSSNPNLQNIPIRTELGRRIREAFVAKPGHLLVSADYSQIELRILAHFSEDPSFLEAFRSGQDIHQRTAAEVFGVPPDAVTSEQRRIAKAINFGLVFGQTDFGLAQVLRIPRAEARAYIDSYFARYAGVRTYMERAIADAREAGRSRPCWGGGGRCPRSAATRAQDRAYAERIARNTPIQGSAADLLKLAMIRIDHGIETGAAPVAGGGLAADGPRRAGLRGPRGGAAELMRWVKTEMETVYKLAVPLVVDVGSGGTWGAAH